MGYFNYVNKRSYGFRMRKPRSYLSRFRGAARAIQFGIRARRLAAQRRTRRYQIRTVGRRIGGGRY